MRRFTALVRAAAALALAACADEPTRPSARAPRAVSDASLTAAAPLAFRQLTAGSGHSCGVTTDGVAYCWGSNDVGQLGIGSADVAPHPRPARVAGGLTFRQITAGFDHTCGITTAGRVYCWGENFSGQLGDGGTTDRFSPRAVAGGLTFRQLNAGWYHTCGITTGGVAYCWGSNFVGQLGSGRSPDTCEFDDEPCSTRPIRVAGGIRLRQLSAGLAHTCGVTTADVGYCWGSNFEGQLGDGTSGNIRMRPVRVIGDHSFRQIGTGAYHTCGVTTGGAGYCWGSNESGKLGNGTTGGPRECQLGPCSPRPVRVVGRLVFRFVSAGGFTTCGVTTAQVAYCWGTGGFLGDGTTTTRVRPVEVVGGRLFRQLDVGGAHSCGVTTNDAAFCWGGNGAGQLGDGTSGNIRTRPVAVVGPRR